RPLINPPVMADVVPDIKALFSALSKLLLKLFPSYKLFDNVNAKPLKAPVLPPTIAPPTKPNPPAAADDVPIAPAIKLPPPNADVIPPPVKAAKAPTPAPIPKYPSPLALNCAPCVTQLVKPPITAPIIICIYSPLASLNFNGLFHTYP